MQKCIHKHIFTHTLTTDPCIRHWMRGVVPSRLSISLALADAGLGETQGLDLSAMDARFRAMALGPLRVPGPRIGPTWTTPTPTRQGLVLPGLTIRNIFHVRPCLNSRIQIRIRFVAARLLFCKLWRDMETEKLILAPKQFTETSTV